MNEFVSVIREGVRQGALGERNRVLRLLDDSLSYETDDRVIAGLLRLQVLIETMDADERIADNPALDRIQASRMLSSAND